MQRKIGPSKSLFDGTLIIAIHYGKFSEKDVQDRAEPKGGEEGWQRLPGINIQARFKGQAKQRWGRGHFSGKGSDRSKLGNQTGQAGGAVGRAPVQASVP